MQTQTFFDGAAILDADPFNAQTLVDPLEVDEIIREAAPVVYLDKYKVWFTGRHDLVEQVFRDYETFESSSGTGMINTKKQENWRKQSVILENDPPSHTKYRRVMASVLSKRVVRRLTSSFQQEADRLVSRVLEHEYVDGASELAEAFPLKVLPDALGFHPEGRAHLLPYSKLNFNAAGPRNELYAEAVDASREAVEFVEWQMRREALAADGLGQRIYAFADSGEISEEDAGMLVRTFLSAGLDTTIFTIQSALRWLAERPDVWSRVQDDPKLVATVFEETLRITPPSPFAGRTTTRAVRLGDAQIPAGEKVILHLAAANRDPRRWENPHSFDLDRDLTGHLAFGTGIHGCVGQIMARMEAECLLSAVARQVKTIELAGTPRPVIINWLRGYEELPLRITPR